MLDHVTQGFGATQQQPPQRPGQTLARREGSCPGPVVLGSASLLFLQPLAEFKKTYRFLSQNQMAVPAIDMYPETKMRIAMADISFLAQAAICLALLPFASS